jgi:NDP-sugar pyrophosphorylase family protein
MKAIVLCAGYGTRLGELTRHVPKPMLPVGEHPLLEYIVCNLVRHGFDQIAVNLHFMPEAIRDYFGDGSHWGSRLFYSYEPELLGTAGGVKRMAAFLGADGPFLIHYGDVLTNQDFTAMLRFHQERRALATLLVHQRAESNSALCVDGDGCIVRFLERPSAEEQRMVADAWVFSGVAVCHSEFLDAIPVMPNCDLPRDVLTSLTETRRLFAFPLTGERFAVDSPARLAAATAAVRQGHFPLLPATGLTPMPSS